MNAAEADWRQEDQHVDLPDLGRRTGRQQRHGRPAPDPLRSSKARRGNRAGEGPDYRRDGDIGDHLDRQRRAQHSAGPVAGEIEEGEQSERDRRQPRADQRDDLGALQMAIGPIGQGSRSFRDLAVSMAWPQVSIILESATVLCRQLPISRVSSSRMRKDRQFFVRPRPDGRWQWLDRGTWLAAFIGEREQLAHCFEA